VLVGCIFDDYRKAHSRLLKQHSVRTVVALTAAFDCVDSNEDGSIDFQEWCALLRRYFYMTELLPSASRSAVGRFVQAWCGTRPSKPVTDEDDTFTSEQLVKMRTLFGMLDTDGNGAINLPEFLSLMEVLSLNLEVTVAPSLLSRRSRLWLRVKGVLERAASWHVPRVRAWVTSPRFEGCVMFVVALALVALFAQSSRGNHSAEAEFWFGAVDWAFTVVFLIEVGLKVTGLGLRLWWVDPWNRVDFVLVGFSVALKFAVAVASTNSVRLSRMTRLLRVVRSFRSLRSLKTLAVLKRLSTAASAFVHIAPVMLDWGRVVGLVFYAWSALGCELFKGAQDDLRQRLIDHPELNHHHRLDETANFDSFLGAALVLITVFSGSNWSYAMLRVMEVRSRYAAWYFCIFFLVTVTVLSSVLTAIAVEVYLRVQTDAKKDVPDSVGSPPSGTTAGGDDTSHSQPSAQPSSGANGNPLWAHGDLAQSQTGRGRMEEEGGNGSGSPDVVAEGSAPAAVPPAVVAAAAATTTTTGVGPTTTAAATAHGGAASVFAAGSRDGVRGQRAVRESAARDPKPARGDVAGAAAPARAAAAGSGPGPMRGAVVSKWAKVRRAVLLARKLQLLRSAVEGMAPVQASGLGKYAVSLAGLGMSPEFAALVASVSPGEKVGLGSFMPLQGEASASHRRSQRRDSSSSHTSGSRRERSDRSSRGRARRGSHQSSSGSAGGLGKFPADGSRFTGQPTSAAATLPAASKWAKVRRAVALARRLQVLRTAVEGMVPPGRRTGFGAYTVPLAGLEVPPEFESLLATVEPGRSLGLGSLRAREAGPRVPGASSQRLPRRSGGHREVVDGEPVQARPGSNRNRFDSSDGDDESEHPGGGTEGGGGGGGVTMATGMGRSGLPTPPVTPDPQLLLPVSPVGLSPTGDHLGMASPGQAQRTALSAYALSVAGKWFGAAMPPPAGGFGAGSPTSGADAHGVLSGAGSPSLYDSDTSRPFRGQSIGGDVELGGADPVVRVRRRRVTGGNAIRSWEVALHETVGCVHWRRTFSRSPLGCCCCVCPLAHPLSLFLQGVGWKPQSARVCVQPPQLCDGASCAQSLWRFMPCLALLTCAGCAFRCIWHLCANLRTCARCTRRPTFWRTPA
jgi:hypothetical protein